MTGKDLALMLSRKGQKTLAEALDLSIAEISRKLSDQPDHGWSLEQITKALAAVGLKVVSQDDQDSHISIQRDELTALNLLASRYLNRRVNGDGAGD